MAGNADEMLFPINGEPPRNFYAGSLPQGRQALITLSEAGEIVVAVFGPQGELLHVIHEALASPPIIPDDEQFEEYLKQQFGFAPGPIRVRAFRLSRGELAVYRLPERYQKFLREPNDPGFDMEERMTFPSLIEDWERAGLFVLEVGPCDFWLDQTGEVIAS
ncbi:MAG: hypothetical protein L0191_00500 [Acidobacteria bacterium]|nr:hypothetical protein [Acidobacteriota bacterium]